MTGKSSIRILVVEDDLGQQKLHKNFLGQAGYSVVIASNYQEALIAIKNHEFDIAVIDVRLDESDPKNVDGLRVLAQIIKLDKKTKSILATSYWESFRGLEDYAYAVWEKDQDRAILLSKIEEALKEKEQLSPSQIKQSLHTIIGKMAREKMSLEGVCSLILSEMTSLIKTNFANLSIVLENKLVVKATTAGEVGEIFDVENSISGLAVKRQSTVYIPDISVDKNISALFKPALGKDMKSELVVPLNIGLDPIAVLNFENQEIDAFHSDDIKLIEELAGQVAIAINSARLQDQTNTVRKLSEISSEINTSIDKGDTIVAGIAVEKMLDFMRCDKGAVFNYEMDRSKIDFLAHRGLSDVYILSDLLVDSPRTLAFQTRQPVVVTDIHVDERFSDVRELAKQEGFRALLELPLQVRSKMVGSISAYYKEIHYFESEELALAKLFADHVAIALNNAKQYEDLETAKNSQKLAAIGELSGDIVHRMNSPLGAIRANLEIICDDYKELLIEKPDLEEIIKHIQSLTEGAIYMVREMREKARGQVLKNIDVVASINVALRDIVMPNNVFVENHLEKSNPIIIRANQNLSKVFKNLIRNACDAMPEGGKLILDAQLSSNFVNITVQDTGVGISDDFRNEIFDILSVFSKKRKDGGGHGLGLWYCRAYVEACGGEFPDPESIVGQGSKFSIRFPLVVE